VNCHTGVFTFTSLTSRLWPASAASSIPITDYTRGSVSDLSPFSIARRYSDMPESTVAKASASSRVNLRAWALFPPLGLPNVNWLARIGTGPGHGPGDLSTVAVEGMAKPSSRRSTCLRLRMAAEGHGLPSQHNVRPARCCAARRHR
jgi:hypothetical protein